MIAAQSTNYFDTLKGGIMTILKNVVLTAILALLSVEAFAEPVQPQGPSAMMQLIFFGGFILIFYFLMWRPQSKRAKEHRKLMESISKGDEVLTTGGLIGRVSKVSETGYVVLELSETTEVTIKRDFVAAVLPKGTMKAI